MEKLRLIQCGVGGFVHQWLNDYTTLSPDFELVAIVDTSEAQLGMAAEVCKLPPERRFLSLEAALASVEADAVLTVTPPPVHLHHARLAFGRGMHLLTEKPLADTLEKAQEMIRHAEAAGRHLMVSQQYRYRPVVQKLKELVSCKVAGEFGHGHIDFCIPADFKGTFRETMDFPLLVDMAIHHLDLIRCVTGRDIVKVSAQSFRPSWSSYRHDCGLKLLIELEGGLPFSYSGDWSASGRATSWNGSWRLQCSEGAIHMENDRLSVERCQSFGRDHTTETVEATPLPHCEPGSHPPRFRERHPDGEVCRDGRKKQLGELRGCYCALRSVKEGRAIGVAPSILC